MLLRSSSTTSVQTLFCDSPNGDKATTVTDHRHSQNLYHRASKFSSSFHGVHRHHHLHLNSLSRNSSPFSHSFSGLYQFSPKADSPRRHPFRRARSDSNLEGLASASVDLEDFFSSKPSSRSLHLGKSMLRNDLSFSIYNSTDGFGAETEKEDIEIEDLLGPSCTKGYLERSATIGDSIEAMGSSEFSFEKEGMSLIEEGDSEKEEEEDALNGFENLGFEEVARPASPPMYLATGLGIDGNGVGGGFADFTPTSFDGSNDVEEYYKRMVAADPSNSLFLRNYGQFLRSKGDLLGAEEYFFQATLADPEDGEILLQYAELVWELHHDKERALSYFEQAAHAAPGNSHILAAYARFLWNIDEDEEESDAQNDHTLIKDDKVLVELQNTVIEEQSVSSPLHLASGIGIDVAGFWGGLDSVKNKVAGFGDGDSIEEFHKKMVEENPCNPLFLRNYAQFLCESKGDLQRAEEYYSRAILSDPGDGETISQYAKLVWELNHDKDKALHYFERAVQATPEDSHILAAYASFLWETEDEEEHNTCLDRNLVPLRQAAAMTSANAKSSVN